MIEPARNNPFADNLKGYGTIADHGRLQYNHTIGVHHDEPLSWAQSYCQWRTSNLGFPTLSLRYLC